jgi:hypothetical protein
LSIWLDGQHPGDAPEAVVWADAAVLMDTDITAKATITIRIATSCREDRELEGVEKS